MRKIFLLTVLVLHILFVILSIDQPFHGDEVIIPEAARGALRTGGIPVFDYGINSKDFEQSVHVPLYLYIISGFIYLFGYNVYSIRAVAAMFNFFVVILVYLIIKEILKNNRDREFYAILGTAFYALNPLVIQSSILIDIDGGLLNFSMYLFLYLFIKEKNFLYLVPSLILVFLSKEIGPIALFGTLFIFYLVTFDFKKFPGLVGLFVFSGLISLAILKISSVLIGFDMNMIFRHNFGERPALTFFGLLKNLWEFKAFTYFASPFFIFLFFIFCLFFYYKILIREVNFNNDPVAKNMLLFNLIGLLTILLYLYLGGSSWGFPKYQITGVAGICVFIACFSSMMNVRIFFKRIFYEKIHYLILLAVILTFYFLFFVGDPLIPEIDVSPGEVNINQSLILAITSFTKYFIVPLAIVLIIFYLFNFKKRFLLSLFYLSFFIFIYINVLHSIADYSTYNKYGDYGVLEVTDYIKQKKIPASSIASYVHIGSYLNTSEYHEITFSYNDPEKFKKEIIENERIIYIIVWKRDIDRIGENMRHFSLEKIVGSYYVFKKNNLYKQS